MGLDKGSLQLTGMCKNISPLRQLSTKLFSEGYKPRLITIMINNLVIDIVERSYLGLSAVKSAKVLEILSEIDVESNDERVQTS